MITLETRTDCRECKGTGHQDHYDPGDQLENCWRCGGAGWVTTSIFLAKVFKSPEGSALAEEIHKAVNNGNFGLRRVVVIDHPPTEGLVPLLEGLGVRHVDSLKAIHLRDHHGDAERDAPTVAACRKLLGERAVIETRTSHPACATLVQTGEFAGDIIVADADQDGLTAALKAAGVSYPELEADAGVLDGPATGKTEQALSSLGYRLVRAWGAIPPFGAPGRDQVFIRVVEAFATAAQGNPEGVVVLNQLAGEYERKVEAAKQLVADAKATDEVAKTKGLPGEFEPFTGFRLLDVPRGVEFDPLTLAAELDRGVLVSGRRVTTGPIAKTFGNQISLARSKDGEGAAVDLAELAVQAFGPRPEAGWKPENGVISNTPFLLHLSPERWEVFKPVLEAALKA